MNPRASLLPAVILALTLASGCARHETSTTAPDSSIRAVTLPEVAFALPDAPGRDAAMQCVTCHSLRYLATQPRLPRKTWTAEVDKMIKTYGAPIPTEQERVIVDYLVAFNGRED